jgi:hypothetical protein
MVGNLLPRRKPHPFVLLRMFDESPQTGYPTWASYQARMQADRQHLRTAVLAFAIQLVKRTDQIRSEVVG